MRYVPYLIGSSYVEHSKLFVIVVSLHFETSYFHYPNKIAHSHTAKPSAASTELLVTTFGVLGKTPAYHVSNIAAVLANTSQHPTVEKLEDSVQWTNFVEETPADVFGNPHIITTAGGFL